LKVKAKKPIPQTMRIYFNFDDYIKLNAGKVVSMKKIPENLKEYLKREVKNGDQL